MKPEKIICIHCDSANTVRAGQRKNKLQSIQRYKCRICNKTFIENRIKHKSYPIKIILNSISTYNLGHSQQQTSKILAKKFKIKVPQRTVSEWINQYKDICVFARLRNRALKLYSPKEIIFKQTLHHIQPYTFKYHQAKLNLLTQENPQFAKLKDYIEKINSKEFPHHIFTYNKDNNANNQRASQIKFPHLKITKIKKLNMANKLANLALNLVKTNKDRHQATQDFFLTNDSTTIAAEMPVYLTNWDAGYYRNQKGFVFPLNNHQTPITGHIDLLQIRNNLLHILDYKPNSNLDKEQTVQQLTIYALALSRKLNLELRHFKAAWFHKNQRFLGHKKSSISSCDEKNYFEFYPLHAVYEKGK